MAEKRQISASVLLKFTGKDDGKASEKIDLFASEQWRGGEGGLFRMRRGGKFVDNPDGTRLHVSPAEVGRLVARALGAAMGVPAWERRPDIPRGTHVRVVARELAGKKFYVIAHTSTPPHLGADGLYRVWVYVPAEGHREMRCKDLDIVCRPAPPERGKTTEETPCNG